MLRLAATAAFVIALITGTMAFGMAEPARKEVPPARKRWQNGTVKFAVSSSFAESSPAIKAGSDVAGAVARAAGTWQRAANVSIAVTDTGKQSLSPSEKGDGVSLITVAGTGENLAFFPNTENVAAKTRVFYDRRGNITEADIVLNPLAQFSTDGTPGTFDLETVLTHEIGHALGLRHSPVLGSMMYDVIDRVGISTSAGYQRRELSLEDLSQLRSRYGIDGEDECCGSIAGRLPATVSPKEAFVIVEDDLGRVAGSSPVAADRSFAVAGLSAGNYTAYSIDASHTMTSALRGDALVEVRPGIESRAELKPNANRRVSTLEFLGSNGLLGRSAVVLEQGGYAMMLSGGKRVDTDGRLSFSGPAGIDMLEPPARVDYSDSLDALGFQIFVPSDSATGVYSLRYKDRLGSVSVLPGALILSRDGRGTFSSAK